MVRRLRRRRLLPLVAGVVALLRRRLHLVLVPRLASPVSRAVSGSTAGSATVGWPVAQIIVAVVVVASSTSSSARASAPVLIRWGLHSALALTLLVPPGLLLTSLLVLVLLGGIPSLLLVILLGRLGSALPLWRGSWWPPRVSAEA